ncbi:chromosomal replication initiator protein [Lewinella marina]|uniref:Chromosomal replication initiator protein DnaA n=1 Tax=Neolewinella marina TaxID=438751 RepID=A0A2G0CHW5_9BACT|nr:chromosomal replication initiator protein DnaA [Neolewinella marina]NJB85311.1 chromosomal replication initiator protein [Neolewinella marina]PHK99573.1 chromosomal replication initiator protein DnaA [Neolewinella marina]
MDHTVVWDNCLQTIRHSVDPQSYQTWFVPIRPVALNSNELTIQVPHRLFYEFLEEHYIDVLKLSLNQALGTAGRLQYRIKPSRQPEPAGFPHAPKATAGKPAPTPSNPFVIPGMTRPRIESNLNGKYTFDNFIEGDCNSLARNAAKAVADNPANTAFNPLVIHGPVGLGKTHLLKAVGNRIAEKFPNKSVLYVTTDTFTNQLVSSIGNNTTNDLVNWYQNVDVLLVDDIQQLINRKKTQDVFFNLFNVLRQNNKAIVMTCDRPIIELDIEERLRSRFQWGLTADLSAPALETRMAILAAKASANEVSIPPQVMEFICYHIQNNIRQLEGVLNNLVLHRGVNQGREIDLELARQVLKNFVTEINREVTPEVIQRTVAEYYNLDVEKLASATRRRHVVLARQISMFLVKQFTDQSLKAIGRMFGGRDHATVIYSIRTVRDLMETNDDIKKALEELERKIRAGQGNATSTKW